MLIIIMTLEIMLPYLTFEIIIIIIMFSYHRLSFPRTSPLEPVVNLTTQTSSFFPYDV
jgi:fucose 4-O-acetylase-like acetyltransferase